MNRPLSNAVDINPHLRRGWTVLIQVLENGHVQQSRSGNDFKRIGTKLTTLVYSNNLRYFANTLIPYRRYYIATAVVIPNDTKYHITSNPYSWILNSRTLVEKLVEAIPATLTCKFEFTKFSDLHKHADSENLQNVRAIVLKCLPSMDQGSDIIIRRDLVIVNEEKTLLLLTLWNEFEQNEGSRLANMVDSGPMIFRMKLKVTTFNCLSLTIRGASGLMINPPVTKDLQMHEWYDNNHHELQRLLEIESYKDHNLLLPYPHPEEFVSVAIACTSLNNLRTAWVKGKIKLSTDQRRYWFTACANCKKSLDADLTWMVTCPSCKVESEVEPLSRFMIDIHDETGGIHATICSPDVDMFIPFTAVQLKESEEMGINVRDAIATSIEHQTIIAFVRSYEVTIRGQKEMKVSVVKAYKSTDIITLPCMFASMSTADSTTKEETGSTTKVEADHSVPSVPSTTASGKKQGTTSLIRECTAKKNKPSAN